MRRICVPRSTAGPSKVQCFGTTASCSLNHLPSITIRADDRFQKVATGGPCSAIVTCSCDVLNRNRQCGAECKPHDDQCRHRRPAVGAAVGATTDAYVHGSVCVFHGGGCVHRVVVCFISCGEKFASIGKHYSRDPDYGASIFTYPVRRALRDLAEGCS